jgi:hypothetical protein
VPSFSVELTGEGLLVRDGSARFEVVPSMEHPAFRRVLEEGFVSPPSFGPAGDLKIYSAAFSKPATRGRYEWFASADWRRGRIQVDRQGSITDIPMEPYGGGRGKLGDGTVDIALDYTRRTASITANDFHSALGKWTPRELRLEADAGAGAALDAAFVVALFLWCARPAEFLVRAPPPFM